MLPDRLVCTVEDHLKFQEAYRSQKCKRYSRSRVDLGREPNANYIECKVTQSQWKRQSARRRYASSMER